MVLFLSVALVIVFVFLLLYGFVVGDKDGFKLNGGLKIALGIIVGVAVIFAVIWAMGLNIEVFDILFKQSWSETFWTNFLFVAIFVFVVAWVVKKGSD
jgi:hypothetical protein